ncbi:translation machinery-associated protein 16 [Amia ocellicauda]|uniref:translation machinery-associated protein 16 n=1 Tax=Amia ocellicauda TaxID=2972642 RepID=UPI003463C04A
MPKAGKGKAAADKKPVHPYSRKAAQIARGAIRQEKKERHRTEKALRLNAIGEKLLWFQSQLDPNKSEYTKADVCELVERYLRRFDGELEQIALVNGIRGRQGRQHGSRESALKQAAERERTQYEGYGMEIPDLINSKHLKTFREWSGDLKKLPNIKMRRVSAKAGESEQREAEEGEAAGVRDDNDDDMSAEDSDPESQEDEEL